MAASRFRPSEKYRLAAGLFGALSLALVYSPDSRAASETPPKGPPWTKDFLEAHRIAFEQGKPIFVYSTKTH